MNKSFKKVLSLLMTLAMILTALPLAGVTAFAEDETHTSGDFKYRILEDGTAKITVYTGSAETLDIPSKLDGYTVTSIGANAFFNCDSLTSITIPESVESIGEDAFGYCDSLTSIAIPNSVTSIGYEAFCVCYNLTEINVDANNKNYSSQDGVLFDKNKTELIQYPIGNTRTSYDIPNDVTSIGDDAFEYCDGLTSVTIPDSVTSIGDGAFNGCDSLTSVTIPNGVTSIGHQAFSYCDSLTNVTIPDSVTSIGESAFYGCESLTEINVDANNKNYASQDGVLFNKNKTELIQYPIGNERTSYDIPNSVISIVEYAFYNCAGLTSVTIPNGVTSIDSCAFAGCESLTSITIPDSVTSIGEYAFHGTGYYNNPSNWENGILYSVLYIDNCLIEGNYEMPSNYTVKEGTRVIAEAAFFDIGRIETIKICKSVTNIGEYVFTWCPLTEITVDESNENYSSQDGVLFNKDKTELIKYPRGSERTSYKIPNGVKKIHHEAFFSCYNLSSVTMPYTVTSIDDYVFNNCECVFYGYAGSFAESYAKENSHEFVALEEHPSMEKVPAKAATCTEDGNIEYYHCSDCNKNFKDEYGYDEIADIVVKATGHKYENGVCTVCGEKDPNAPKPTGEVNGDGKLSTVDAKWILQNIAKSREFSDEQFKAADLNGDGKLSVVDVKWVLQIIAGMRDAETLESVN